MFGEEDCMFICVSHTRFYLLDVERQSTPISLILNFSILHSTLLLDWIQVQPGTNH